MEAIKGSSVCISMGGEDVAWVHGLEEEHEEELRDGLMASCFTS